MKHIIFTLLISLVGMLAHAETIQINDFSGGLNTKLSKTMLPNNQCYDCLNVDFDEQPGSISTRKGYTVFASTTATKTWEYPKSDGQTYLVKWHEQNLHFTLDDGDTWTVIRSSLNWNVTQLQMVVFEDKCWFANGIEDVFYFDGDTHDGKYYEIPKDNDGNVFIPKFKFITVHNNRIMGGYTFDNVNYIYFSDPGVDPRLEEAWPEDNYEPISFRDGGEITALYSMGDILLVFGNYTTWGVFGQERLLWLVREINANYGCKYQESIAVDKGTLKFLSHLGIVSMNGTNFDDIDFWVSDEIDKINNINGDTSFIQITNTSDFDAGTLTNTNSDESQLDLTSYEAVFDDTNLDESTLGSTEFKTDHIRLSTSTQAGLQIVGIEAISANVYTLLDKGSAVTQDGVTYFNIDTPPNITLENNGDRSPPGLSVAYPPYDHATNMYDTGTGSMTSMGNLNATPRVFSVGVRKTGPSSPEFQVSPLFVFTIPLGVDGVDLDSLEMTADFNMHPFTGYWERFRYDDADLVAKLNDITIQMNVQVDISFTDGSPAERIVKEVMRRECTKTQISLNSSNPPYQGNFGSVLFPSGLDGNNTLKIDFNYKHKVEEIVLTFGGTPVNMLRWGYGYMRIECPLQISPIYDIRVYERTTANSYNTDGYSITPSTNIGGTSNNVLWGNLTIDDYSDFSGETTTMTYYTRTSTSPDTPGSDDYSSWAELAGSVNEGVQIDSPTGKWIQVMSSYTTTASTNTPALYGITVEAIEPTGGFISKQYNAAKNNGGWGNLVVSEQANGQTISHYVKVGTGTTDLDTTSWTSITAGELISGTTNETYIQYMSSLTSTDGTKNPVLESVTFIYTPTTSTIVSPAISMNDRYMISVASGGSSSNILTYVNDKNRNWTKYDWDVLDFTRFKNKDLFTDGTNIYQIGGADDNGTAINSEYRKYFNFGLFSYDKWVDWVYILGSKRTGTLNLKYLVENETAERTKTFNMAGTGIFRFKQPFMDSAVQSYDMILQCSGLYEIYGMETHYSIDTRLGTGE